MNIGYLVPQFPGQTHGFFWREARALRELDITPHFVSTSAPDRRIQSHSWAAAAREATEYLFPITPWRALAAVARIALGGPRLWWRLWPGIRSRSPKRLLRNLALVGIATDLVRRARHHGWQHLQVHSCGDSALIAAFARLIGGLGYSLTLHGDIADYGPQQSFKWRHARFGIVITQALRTQLLAHLGPTTTIADLAVAPMGIDPSCFRRTAPYQPWRGTGPARLVSCARLNPGKGHQDVIRAVALVRDHGIDVQLTICGQDEQGGDGFARTLRALVTELHLDTVVTLTGAVDENRLKHELERAHLFVLASHQEALGVAYMEAMAMELPTVGSRVGGVGELIDDGVDGVLIPAQSPPAIAGAIQALLGDPERCLQLSARGRGKIERSFHSGISAAVIAGRLRTAATDRRAGPG